MVGSFCSAYLLDIGFSNSEIGLIIALASVVSVFLQPVLADLADRSKKLDQIGVAGMGTVVMMVLTVGLMIFRHKTAALWVIYILVLAWELALQPVLNSFSRKLSESGHKINFGICRSGGSLGYAVLMIIMGTLTERFGTRIIPGSGMITLAVLLGLLLLT
ncbi:MAG: MFS transporter, partial [Firmicutes bacterium]|nr:MFS transporter [Bacillota bacterium]